MNKSKLAERGEAKIEIVTGAIQEVVGRSIGNDTMEAKGAAHRAAGHARDEVAGAPERKLNRAEAAVEVVAGAAQQAVGRVAGDTTLEAKGKARKVVGTAHGLAARRAEHREGKVQEIAGAAKKQVGRLLDDPVQEVSGAAKELTGKARQALSK